MGGWVTPMERFVFAEAEPTLAINTIMQARKTVARWKCLVGLRIIDSYVIQGRHST
jgi:hypothetical protein